MKFVKKALLGLVALPLALLLVVVLVQAYYHLSPVEVTAEAKALDAEATMLPAVTDNGFRAYGILAPEGMDPVAYGKCLIASQKTLAEEKRRDRSNAPRVTDPERFEEYSKRWYVREQALELPCSEGKSALRLPREPQGLKISPSTTEAEWNALHALVPEPVLRARVDAVWEGEARRLGAVIDAPMVRYDALSRVPRWQIADARAAWLRGEHDAATVTWARLLADTTRHAGDSLIDAMISVAIQTQTLLAIQSAVSSNQALAATDAAQLFAAMGTVERVPDAVVKSLLFEWRLHQDVLEKVDDVSALSSIAVSESGAVRTLGERLSRWGFDRTDTLNLFARNNRWSANAMLTTANGKPAPMMPDEWQQFGCHSLQALAPACLPFMRNPVGRVLAAIALPSYADYGTRVADLRNLAAATRLTISARAQGVTAAKLAALVASAPGDQRDVFSGEALAYDATARKLKIKLRTKSSILGNDGYELAL